MKKVSKIVLAIMLVASLALIVTGCGNSNDNGKSKTYNALSKAFSGDNYIVSLDEEGVSTVIIAVKGENMYMNVKETDSNISIVYKDGSTYIISHDDEMYMVSEGKDEEMDENMSILSKEDLAEIENAEYKTGKEEINGTEYYYEEYKIDGEADTERYYFDGDNLVYIKTIDEDGEEEILKVLELSSEVDDSIFEIPSNYEKLDV